MALVVLEKRLWRLEVVPLESALTGAELASPFSPTSAGLAPA